jgi:type III pantothenate kinase
MISLIIDAGNTYIKVKCFDDDKIVDAGLFLDELEAQNFISTHNSMSKIRRCIVSDVRDLNKSFTNFLQNNFNTIFFSHTVKLPITLNYKTPETLGKDRIAAVCGAAVLFPRKSILIIDAGTAITYDILTAENLYLGGNISPGLQIRFKALNTFTGKLPLVHINKERQNLFGETTEEAIRSGVLNGMIYEIDGFINDFKTQYSDLLIVFTGGDCFFFEKLLKNRIFAEPNLTAIGLNKILELNV